MIKIQSKKVFEEEFALMMRKMPTKSIMGAMRRMGYTSSKPYYQATSKLEASDNLIRMMAFYEANVSKFLSAEDFEIFFNSRIH